MTSKNKGFDPAEIERFKKQIAEGNGKFVVNEDEERTEEFVNFFFLGKYQGRAVIYDAALYTLKLHHQSELYELAEHKAAKKFPEFKSIKYEEDENGDFKTLDDLEEDIGLFMAETMMELEEDETVKVKEFIEIDPHLDFGIGIDAALNIEKITDRDITKFIDGYNEDKLVLDETYYSFQMEEEED